MLSPVSPASWNRLAVRACARLHLVWLTLVLAIALPSAAEPIPAGSVPTDSASQGTQEQERRTDRPPRPRRVIPVRMVSDRRGTGTLRNGQAPSEPPPLQQRLPAPAPTARRVIPVRMVTPARPGSAGRVQIVVPAAPIDAGSVAGNGAAGDAMRGDPTVPMFTVPPAAGQPSPVAPPERFGTANPLLRTPGAAATTEVLAAPRTIRAPGVAPSMVVGRAPEAPVLDGLVSEASWDGADVASDFLQREPNEGQPASERTEVRILYDDENVYVGVIAYDSAPSSILAAELRRDALGGRGGGGRGGSDDTFTVLFDTFHDGRSAFQFTVNALGTRHDALIRNESELNNDWDEAWRAAAQITARGWEAELVIPLSILRFSSGVADWGVDFERQIRRKNEQAIWSNYRRDYEFIAVSQAGDLRGFEDLSVTQRFRLKPYFLGGATSVFQDPGRQSDVTNQLGIDVLKVKLTSNLTADLTYKTDFAQVELDQQRVNLTRFSLFFPEKRDFFLEGANNFSFGQLQRDRFDASEPPIIRLFHSRNIGLSDDGAPIPIDFGGRVTGKVGSGNLGLLHVQTGDPTVGGGQEYSAFRWRQDVLARSSVGALVTNVQRPDGAINTVVGADASFTFFDNLNISAFGARATDDELDEGKLAGQFRVAWQSDLWNASFDIMRIDPGFRSDLGFVLREDIVRRAYRGSWIPRPSVPWLRSVNFNVADTTFHDTSGTLVSGQRWVASVISLESGDSLGAFFTDNFERLDLPFQIHPDVTIPPGDYDFRWFFVFLSTYGGRALSASVSGRHGGFYDGDVFTIEPRVSFRFNERFRISPSFSYNRIELPGGSFTTNVVNANANYSFSDRLLTDALVQYNSRSDSLSVFARLRYIYRVGDDIYLVYRQAGDYDGLRFGRHDRSLTLKVTRSFNW